MSATEISQERRWKVTIHRGDADWPDLVYRYSASPPVRPERLVVTVEIDDAGLLSAIGAIGHGRNIRKDGSLGAENCRIVWDDWAKPLILEAIAEVAGLSWPEPRLP